MLACQMGQWEEGVSGRRGSVRKGCGQWVAGEWEEWVSVRRVQVVGWWWWEWAVEGASRQGWGRGQ